MGKRKKTSTNHLKILRKDLPKGWSEILARNCNCSPALVSYILSGDRRDTKGIVPKAYDMAAKEILRRNIEKREEEKIKAEYHKLKQNTNF